MSWASKTPSCVLPSNWKRSPWKTPTSLSATCYPNVDFYSGIILKALGIPRAMFTVIFAIGRTPGWISHWHEMLSASYRISRPRQLYTGAPRRDFVPLAAR